MHILRHAQIDVTMNVYYGSRTWCSELGEGAWARLM
jgi:hypothetical protein